MSLEHYWSTFGAIEVPDRSQNLTVKFNPTQQNKFRSPHYFCLYKEIETLPCEKLFHFNSYTSQVVFSETLSYKDLAFVLSFRVIHLTKFHPLEIDISFI